VGLAPGRAVARRGEEPGPGGAPALTLPPVDSSRPGSAYVEQLAFELGGDVAFLSAAQGVFYARRVEWPPVSPVLRLLRGLHELEPGRARYVARYRIFCTGEASASCDAAMRVAARHMTAGVAAVDHGVHLDDVPRLDAGSAGPAPRRASPELEPALSAIVDAGPRGRDHGAWMTLAQRLAAEMRRRAAALGRDARSDKPVAALLVDGDGTLLGWATNTGARNPTSHAEVNLVEQWLAQARRPLPRGCRVYSTLKPCKMCAGLLWDSAADAFEQTVFYGDDDPGRYARETVLDARSMARRRVTTNERELRAVLQHQVATPS
jgi:tRNA(Arg) A34 adenosine deaminase TadA